MSVPTVHYLMSGPAHLPYLVVSLRSLRKWFEGPIFVHAYPESLKICERIGADVSLRAQIQPWIPAYRGKNGQFINKIVLMQSIGSLSQECDQMYLDADTVVAGSLETSFQFARKHSFVATQFNDWLSNLGTIKKRINRLVGINGIDQDCVEAAMTKSYPSLNGGVFICNPNSYVLELWREWSLLARHIFICDETVLHAVMAKFWDGVSHQDSNFNVLLWGSMNCSPKYKQEDLKEKDVKIWHFHGDSNVRPDKTMKGFNLWWPLFVHAIQNNVGGIREWINEIDNNYLTECMRKAHIWRGTP